MAKKLVNVTHLERRGMGIISLLLKRSFLFREKVYRFQFQNLVPKGYMSQGLFVISKPP